MKAEVSPRRLISLRGMRGLNPGDLVLIRWRGVPNDEAVGKATEVVDKLHRDGVLPAGVLVANVPDELDIEVMSMTDIDNLIAHLEESRKRLAQVMRKAQSMPSRATKAKGVA